MDNILSNSVDRLVCAGADAEIAAMRDYLARSVESEVLFGLLPAGVTCVLAELDHRAAEIDRLRALVTWRPIETAPHGETVLLGWLHRGAWEQEVGTASFGWKNAVAINISRHGQATHWLPMLPGPEDAA